MAIDTNIQQHDPNGCLFIDQPKPDPFYKSPNVFMTTKPSDPNDVYAGKNTTQVNVTWNQGCTIPGGSDISIMLDLYIGDPTLAMVPGAGGTLSSLTPPLNSINISPGQAISFTTTPPWDASVIPHLNEAGHACLLARVYPSTASPAEGDLTGFPIEDQHYAQHNITVNTSDGQGEMIIRINNGTLLREPQLVSIRAVPNLNPSPATLDAILPSLELIPGFKQIAAAPLKHASFDLSAFKDHQHESLLQRIEGWIEHWVIELIRDLEGKGQKAGGISARAVLPPGYFAKFSLVADLTGSKPGDAHIYEVTQVMGNGTTGGGLMAVLVNT